MAAKYQLITELYQRTGKTVTRNPQAWQNFLSSACRNYKCRFDEQLLIYAQRPDAVAVTTIEVWNKLFKRWVNKDRKGRRNTLKYFFDVSDTHEGYYGSRPVPIWQMNGRYEQAVIERLSDRFGGAENGGLAEVLMETAKNAVEDNLQDYTAQLKGCVKDSFLEELDDYNIEVMYRELATNSVAYGLSQALKVLDTVPINAICSDFYMRDGTGLDLIKEIRCKNITLPFLLMSGNDDTRFIDIARSYDALFCCKTDDLLSKIKAL